MGGKGDRFLKKKIPMDGAGLEGKGCSLVKWKKICKRKKFGGLGIINLRDFNRAILVKWWWKLFDELGSKWVSLLSHSYRSSTGWLSDKNINEGFASLFWKGLRSVKDIFFSGVAMTVNDGRGTRFWVDRWCSKVPLEKLFPQLYARALDPSGTVGAHWAGGGWNIKVPQVYLE